MIITDRVAPKPFAEWLNDYELQRLAFVETLNFVKKLANFPSKDEFYNLEYYIDQAKELLIKLGKFNE